MADLPGGTVTFLLTDVEGSTRRWERQTEAMPAALARHDALIRAAIVEHGGYVVKTMGDAFHAVFRDARLAVVAALDGQRRLQAESWNSLGGGFGGLQVRMALHTGVTEERDGDYYGPPMNRVARLLTIGHGGQMLLSEATAVLTRDDLPPGATLIDLGTHRLKDLTRPERVFQLVVPDLPADFPPLLSLNSHQHNLPIQPTPLIGREQDVRAIHDLLASDEVRLMTLTGPGGTGKTSLGLQVAAEMIDSFQDGVYVVALSPITDPALVPATIAQSLEIRDVEGRSVLDSLKDCLRTRHVLLLLDNFEQVLGAASVVSELLGGSPRLKVLVTSRAPLQLRGEHERPVPPLALPDRRHPPAAHALSQFAAVALFIERAVAIKPDFAVTNENAPAVAEICHRLDGLPLAIELAAARVRLLSPEAMLTRLERRLQLLTGGARDLPARQQTLRRAIDWSHELLEHGEQRLFRRLAVFVGGFSLEAAERVASDELRVASESVPYSQLATSDSLLDALASLVAKSLLRQEEQSDGDVRFGMLETIREYAYERLQASGELPALQDRHRTYYLAFAEWAHPQLQGPQQVAWFDRLERENDNLRAALESGAAERGTAGSASMDGAAATSRVEEGSRLAAALGFFWVLRGRGRENLPRVLALVALAAPGTAARARAATVAAHVLGHMLGDHTAAVPLADEGLGTWRDLGDAAGLAVALVRRGQIALEIGDFPLATALFAEARDLFRALGGLSGPEVPTVLWLAEVAQAQGDVDSAQRLYDEVLTEARARGDNHAVAHSLRELARLHRTRGDAERALALLYESAALYLPLKDLRCTCILLEDLAGVLCERCQPTDAARLLAAAEAVRELVGKPLTRAQIGPHERDLATVKCRLDPESFAAAWAEGRAMSWEQAVAFAVTLDDAPARGSTTSTPSGTAPASPSSVSTLAALTPRESDVARLIARGLSNRQIAEALVISERTADSHVYRMLNKLGFTSRSQIAVWAARHGLGDESA